MKLETEIKQKSFKTPQQKLAVNIIYTGNWLNEHYTLLFKGTTLTVQQYNVLGFHRFLVYTKYSNKPLVSKSLIKGDFNAGLIGLAFRFYAKEFILLSYEN